MQNRVYGGDPANSAVHLSEVYYKRDRTVDELKLLAAYVVLEGHKVNATAVRGLDVLVAKDGAAPKFATSAELETLKTRSTTVHASIEQSLFGE